MMHMNLLAKKTVLKLVDFGKAWKNHVSIRLGAGRHKMPNGGFSKQTRCCWGVRGPPRRSGTRHSAAASEQLAIGATKRHRDTATPTELLTPGPPPDFA